MAHASSPRSSHSSSESLRPPPLKAMRLSSGVATLGSSSSAVDSRAHKKWREQEASSNGETLPYKCKCGRRFRTAQEYGGHQNAHTRPKKFMKDCLERVRSNCLLLPGYRLPPDSPFFLQEEVARLRQKQSHYPREETGSESILSPKGIVRMHPYHSNRKPTVKKNAALNHSLDPSLPFNSFNPKVFGVCQTFHGSDDNLSPTDCVPRGSAEVGAKNTTAYLSGASFTQPIVAPRSINLNLAARDLVSFWNPNHGSENSTPDRGASALMRESAVSPPARGHSGCGASARPGQSPSGVVHVEDGGNPSGVDLELRL